MIKNIKENILQLFNWLFKNKKLQKDIRKEEALKVYKEVRELIEIYHKQLLKGRSYSQDVCNGLRDLFEFRLKVEYEFYKSNSKTIGEFLVEVILVKISLLSTFSFKDLLTYA